MMVPNLTIGEKEKSSKKRKVAESVEQPTEKSTATIASGSPYSSDQRLDDGSSENETPNTPRIASDLSPAKKRKSTSLVPTEIEVDITAPTPPTRRALRLLKKGKAAPPLKPVNRPDTDSEAEVDSQTETTGETKTRAKKKAKPEVEKRSEYGIWIGNLPWSCDKAAVRAFLSVPNTSILSTAITRIHMPSPADALPANHVPDSRTSKKAQNKGFAYVDFATAEHVTEALELSEGLLMGRRVLIKNQKNFEGRPEKTKEEKRLDAGGKPPNRRVFLGNLRYDATAESLTEHFSPCGAIEMVFLATFEDSGKCKGFAWITFAELDAAENAVKGWAMVPQKTLMDDDDGSANSEESATEEETKKHIKPKMKKVWVDKILGRPVRREFAEDAQVRYKKRYGKDGTKVASTATATGDVEDAETAVKSRYRGNKPYEKSNSNDAATVGEEVPQAKPANFYRTTYAPRLTGGMVPSTGKKVVF